MSRAGAPVSEMVIRHRVQFYEVDGAGIVHFSWFFRYMEEAEHALWLSAGLSIAPTAEMAFPRVAATFDYRRPLRFEDEFEARIRIAAIGARTIRYSCDLILGADLAASGGMTIVCVSRIPGQPMRAVPFPAEIVGRFAVAGLTGQRP